jgi:hypothetical protein
LLLLLPSTSANADGAFPDELQIFLPSTVSNQIVLTTNFGFLLSEDNGAHWVMVCESFVSGQTLLLSYQVDPGGTIFAVYGPHVGRSTDEGCTWSATSGDLSQELSVRDLFPDPTPDAGRVALLAVGQNGQPHASLWLSTDDGVSFAPTSVVEQTGDLLGVEYAASEPGLLYVTGAHLPSDGGSRIPFVSVTSDGGWSTFDHAEYASNFPYLAGVDPEQANTLYVRLGSPTNRDALLISHDQGQTFTSALQLTEAMSAFVRASDGTLYVGTRSGALWRQAVGSPAFVRSTGPHFRCLAERNGTLFACGDPLADGYALATSTDQGATFTPLMDYGQIDTLQTCPSVQQACQNALGMLKQQFPPPPPDAGPTNDAGKDGGSGPTPSKPKSSGCHCGMAPSELIGWLLGLVCVRLFLPSKLPRRTK